MGRKQRGRVSRDFSGPCSLIYRREKLLGAILDCILDLEDRNKPGWGVNRWTHCRSQRRRRWLNATSS